MKLLSTGNPKVLKGMKQGYNTYILHLAPTDSTPFGNTCPKATAGCKAACLNTAGRGGMFKKGETTNVIQEARKRKTILFFTDRRQFMLDLFDDIRKGIKQAEKKGFIPCFRLNGTSDLSWEKYTLNEQNVFETFPEVQFYDYTKVLGRKVTDNKNYHLTFSASENNHADVDKAIANGMNIAVVFNKLPESYLNLPVINGDDS